MSRRRNKIILWVVSTLVLGILNLFTLEGAYRVGISRNLSAEMVMLEREVANERLYSKDVLVTAQKLKTKGLGNELAARQMAVRLADDPELADFSFLKADDPVENALQNLPRVLEREDNLLSSAKQANSGVGRLNVRRTISLLVELRDLRFPKERGYRAVLVAYNN